jgi:hypothetical protein
MHPRLVVLAIALAAIACGFKQSNSIDLEQVEGMPVELANVRMAESLVVGLGPGGSASFSSSDRANAIGVSYEAHVVDKAAQYSGVTAQLACRVADHTIVSRIGTDASNQLAAAEVGTKLEGHETFPPTPFADAIPSVCETTLYYSIAPPLDVPKPGEKRTPPADRLQPLGTVCFADDELREGPCSADVLPRVPAATPIAVSRLVGRIGTLDGGGHGVQVSVLATAGENVPEDFMILTKVRCKLADAIRDVAVPMMMLGTRLRPGESFWDSGATPSQSALESEPQWCTVEVLIAQDGTKERLAQWCVRGDAATEGACE